MTTASPALSARFCFFSAPCRSSDGDLVAVAEHLDSLEAGDVDQHAAGDEGRGVLDAELGEATARRDLLGLEAVVVTVAVSLVPEPVELRADLTDLGQHHLLIAAALVRLRVHERPLEMHVEPTRAEERHRRPEFVGQTDYLAGLDLLDGVEHGLRRHQVAGAALIAGAPFRRAARAFGRHGPTRRLRQRDGIRHQRRAQCYRECDALHDILPGSLLFGCRPSCPACPVVPSRPTSLAHCADLSTSTSRSASP